jgi:hypothetical protein
MRFLKSHNLNKFKRTDKSVSSSSVGHIDMRSKKAVLVPKGNELQRPLVPENGQLRYNTDIDDLEAYVDGIWRRIRYKESVEIVQQNVGTGDFVEQYFGPLNPIPFAGQNILVFVENVFQIHNINYTIVQNPSEFDEGWYLFFDEPPPNKAITVLHNFDR